MRVEAAWFLRFLTLAKFMHSIDLISMVVRSWLIRLSELYFLATLGCIQNMDPRSSMDHTCGPSPWTPSWTQSMDFPCGPPLIRVFEDESYQVSKNEGLSTRVVYGPGPRGG